MNSPRWFHEWNASDLPKLNFWWVLTEPIVQWGMWVWISIAELAWAVAREWWIWTLSSVALCRTPRYKALYEKIKLLKKWKKAGLLDKWLSDEDLVKEVKRLKIVLTKQERNEIFREANIEALWQEIRKARTIAWPNWQLWLNMMVAANDYENQVRNACKAWISGIVSWAWLPFDLPKHTAEYPDVALIPILSNAQWVSIMLRKWWKKYKRLPNAVVLEDPSTAGWHLGSSHTSKINDEETKLETSVPATVAYINSFLSDEKFIAEWKELHKDKDIIPEIPNIPVIAAWWATTRADIDRLLDLWASWVQMWTRFLASEESWASHEFKQAIINAKLPEDIMVYVSSAMLPARAIRSSWVFRAIEWCRARIRWCVDDCLSHCAYRDWLDQNSAKEVPAQMCINRRLVLATAWNPPEAKEGALYFTWTSALRIDTIKSVKDIMDWLKKGE